MKIKKILGLAAIILLSSCTKSFLDVNNDPNSVTDVPPKTLLPNTLVSMGFANSNELGRAAALLMQYNANSNSASVAGAYDTWIISGFESQWDNEIYGGTLNNLNIIIGKTQAQSPGLCRYCKTSVCIHHIYGYRPVWRCALFTGSSRI